MLLELSLLGFIQFPRENIVPCFKCANCASCPDAFNRLAKRRTTSL